MGGAHLKIASQGPYHLNFDPPGVQGVLIVPPNLAYFSIFLRSPLNFVVTFVTGVQCEASLSSHFPIVLLQVFGRPCLLLPSGVQYNSAGLCCFRKLWYSTIYFNFSRGF